MSGGVEQNPHILLRLVFGQLGTQADGPINLSCQVADLEVQVRHRLLLPSTAGPNRALVGGTALDAEVGDALARVK